MKKLMVLVLSMLVLACGEKKKDPEVVTVDTRAKSGPEAKEVYVSAEKTAQFKDSLTEVIYDHYNDLKTAFVNTDARAAKTAAEKLFRAVEPLKGSDSLKSAVLGISNETNVEAQREQLPAVTEGIRAIVTGALDAGTLYYQYCPMAFNGKGGYWISNEEQIRNPYFGDKMLACGVVKEELE